MPTWSPASNRPVANVVDVRGINDREFHALPRAFGPGGENDPLIWGQVEIPTSITLKVLHDIIQIAMIGISSGMSALMGTR
jgi:hypothetical protein